jgi:hypothetical protein
LHGNPQSLKAFLYLFLLEENSEYDTNRAIWIPESDAFLCINQGGLVEERVPGAYRKRFFGVQLSSGNPRCSQSLSIISSTVKHAIFCLEFLFGLHDSHYQELELSYIFPRDPPPLCPLTNLCLPKMILQNEKRKNRFDSMAFTPK